MKIYNTYKESKRAYLDYITSHKQRVKDAWIEIQKQFYNHPFVTDKYINWYITKLCNTHDDSKLLEEEFEPYRKYFYPTVEDTDKDVIQKDYDNAWILHYSRNPHHWEYWVDFDKNKERECLKFIREAYCVERVCDWMSMSIFNNNKVKDWYEENKQSMYMSEDDRKMVENLVYNLEEF